MLLENLKETKILLTGTTGFLGKVILEKMLRTLPHIGTIYVLIRGKKNQKPENRFKEVLNFPIFQKLKEIKGDQFEQYVFSKCVVIQGDLLQKQLGLDKDVIENLRQNLDLLINCAASVDFTSPLIDHIHSNVLGTLEVLELANSCKRLQNFIHVSTAYVNSNKTGEIEEKIYNEENEEDPEVMIDRLLKMDPELLKQKTSEIVNDFPNCYTFTKNAVEKIIQKRKRKDLTISIVRPSIIASMDIDDPYKGWVEGFTSCTAAFCLIGLGLIRHSPSPPAVIGDLIPVNYVSDYVILVANFIRNTQKLHVCHSASGSATIPFLWDFTNQMVREYWIQNPVKKQISKVKVQQHNSKFMNTLHIYMTQWAPVKMFDLVAQMTQNKGLLKQSKLMNKGLTNVLMVNDLFGPLASRTWVYEYKFASILLDQMTPEEKLVFNVDIEKIDWYDFLLHYQYGIQRFILKEDRKPPVITDFMRKQNEWYFRQLKWAYHNWDNLQRNVQQVNNESKQQQQLNITTPANQQEGIQFLSKL